MLTLLTSSANPRSLLTPRLLGLTSLAFALHLIQPQIAFSAEKSADVKEDAKEANEETEASKDLAKESSESKVESNAASANLVSEGAPLQIEALGIKITPPKGWEVASNTGNLSLVMKEPRDPKPAYEKAKYQRNITVATIYQASPIDEKRAAELKEQMTKKFSSDSLVKDFQILEHKFFNYRGVNDGLLLFSSMNIGEYPMMQMHVLVSGQDKQFLMSYTDLADQFQDQANGTYNQAWQAMTSIEVTGKTPQRMDEYLRYGEYAAGFFIVLLAGYLLRRKATRFDFSAEADALDAAADDSIYSGARSNAYSGVAYSGVASSQGFKTQASSVIKVQTAKKAAKAEPAESRAADSQFTSNFASNFF